MFTRRRARLAWQQVSLRLTQERPHLSQVVGGVSWIAVLETVVDRHVNEQDSQSEC